MADTPITDYNRLSKESQATIAANAKSLGITPQEYLTSRGGVYKSGYYGDTPEFRRLSDEAYFAAAQKGTGAINTAKFNQIKEAYQKDPNLIEDPYLRSAYQRGAITIDQLMQGMYQGTVGRRGFGTITKTSLNQIGALADGTPLYGWDGKGKPVTDPNGTVYSTTSSSDAIEKFNSGSNPLNASSSTAFSPMSGSGAETDALLAFNKAQAEATTKANRESAFALLKLEFEKYGLGSLVETVKSYIMQGSPVEEVTLKLRATPEYQARFAGNQARLKAGLNVYDEATYLQLENAYDQVFTSYGVTEAAGNTVEARRARYAQFIGGTISPDEVKGRVQLAVAAANEDEVTKATLRELYPMISEKDIVSYFLNPKETLPKLETKVRASQIGAAAVRQGLVTNVATAEELVAMGVTEDEAERAYSAYAGMKPTLDKLSGLERDQELAVNQQVAEGALLKGLASEQRKLEALRQKELARFSGSAGTARGVSLGSAAGGAI